MGVFAVDIEIGSPDGSRYEVVEALVDTGQPYAIVAEDLLAGLGIQPDDRVQFRLPDGNLVEYGETQVRVRLEGKKSISPVVFGPPGCATRVGRLTLTLCGLAADYENERLIPGPPPRLGLRMIPVPVPDPTQL